MLPVGYELVCMQPSIYVVSSVLVNNTSVPTLFSSATFPISWFLFQFGMPIDKSKYKRGELNTVNSHKEYSTRSVFTFSNTDPSGTVTLMQKCWPVSHLFTVYASSISWYDNGHSINPTH